MHADEEEELIFRWLGLLTGCPCCSIRNVDQKWSDSLQFAESWSIAILGTWI